MTDIETTPAGVSGDWAIFPPDRTSDSQRWIRLIEEMDGLLASAASAERVFGSRSIGEHIGTIQTQVEPKSLMEKS